MTFVSRCLHALSFSYVPPYFTPWSFSSSIWSWKSMKECPFTAIKNAYAFQSVETLLKTCGGNMVPWAIAF